MSTEKMDALDVRVRRLVDVVLELRHANQSLRQQLSLAKKEFAQRVTASRAMEVEREDIKVRVEHIIRELDGLALSTADVADADAATADVDDADAVDADADAEEVISDKVH